MSFLSSDSLLERISKQRCIFPRSGVGSNVIFEEQFVGNVISRESGVH